MNNIPYIHNPKDKNNLVNTYFIALIPLLIFSFYKNGILLYTNNLINLKNIFIPLYFYIISTIVAIIVSKIIKEDLKENILISLVCSLGISINTNMIIYPFLLFALLFIINCIKRKIKTPFNYTSLIRILLVLSLLLNSYSYLNIGEKLNKFNYNFFDIFLGYSTGGLGTTSLLLVIVSFIILAFNKYYKKEVAISASISYILTSIIILIINPESNLITLLLNGTIYFYFVFVAADLNVTPYSKKGMIIYGSIIGLITALLNLVLNFNETSCIAIFITSLGIPIINKYINKRYIKSL